MSGRSVTPKQRHDDAPDGLEPAPEADITVVVPCYDEAEVLASLYPKLLRLSCLPRLAVLFVDDGSTDGTADKLEDWCRRHDGWRLIRQPRNRGIAAAILTGIKAAGSEVVASLDADGSYDPQQLLPLLPRLRPGIDLVTASPYHPQGQVVGVPPWRLFLSKTLSAIYRRVLKVDLHTFTSCFRVYRRRAFLDLELREKGFAGIAEMLAVIVRSGGGVDELPATLRCRQEGHSKMRVVRVALAHLRLLASGFGRSPAHERSPTAPRVAEDTT